MSSPLENSLKRAGGEAGVVVTMIVNDRWSDGWKGADAILVWFGLVWFGLTERGGEWSGKKGKEEGC